MHWDEQTLRRTIAAAFEQGGLDAICQLVISLLSEQEARHQASSRNQRNSWRTVCLVLAIPFMIQAMELALSPTLACHEWAAFKGFSSQLEAGCGRQNVETGDPDTRIIGNR